MTFDEMVKIEPRLGELKDEARNMANILKKPSDRNSYWYQELKRRFVKLVGFWADKPELRNSDDYSIAYEELYSTLNLR